MNLPRADWEEIQQHDHEDEINQTHKIPMQNTCSSVPEYHPLVTVEECSQSTLRIRSGSELGSTRFNLKI